MCVVLTIAALTLCLTQYFPEFDVTMSSVLRSHSDWVYSVAVSPDMSLIASTGDDSALHLHTMSTFQQV